MQQLRITLDSVLEALPLVQDARTEDKNGQSVVTALLINKHFGGQLLMGRQNYKKHMFNKIRGVLIDANKGASVEDYGHITVDPAPDAYITAETWGRVAVLEKRLLDIINAPYHYGW